MLAEPKLIGDLFAALGRAHCEIGVGAAAEWHSLVVHRGSLISTGVGGSTS
jgi:hypothetical protein